MLELEPLRIPSGWMIGINSLYTDLASGEDLFPGAAVFCAWNHGRRFRIDIDWLPEWDPDGRFILTVAYQPWPRTDRGRRRKDAPFEFNADEEMVHRSETRSYRELLSRLDHWMDRCSTWTREGN
ncbi:hypothetical protein [Brevundimonas sp.]|uniref:hypothetical protein n=1 Tax=Brevundimonas sp. TaxID=1871086 RepID=UPI002FC8EE1A